MSKEWFDIIAKISNNQGHEGVLREVDAAIRGDLAFRKWSQRFKQQYDRMGGYHQARPVFVFAHYLGVGQCQDLFQDNLKKALERQAEEHTE